MKPYRHFARQLLAEGGALPSWTLAHAAGVWTLREDRRIVARWREGDARGVGIAIEGILATLAGVREYAQAAARTSKQHATGGGRRALQRKRDELMRLAQRAITRREKPAARALAAAVRVHPATAYRWLKAMP